MTFAKNSQFGVIINDTEFHVDDDAGIDTYVETLRYAVIKNGGINAHLYPCRDLRGEQRWCVKAGRHHVVIGALTPAKAIRMWLACYALATLNEEEVESWSEDLVSQL